MDAVLDDILVASPSSVSCTTESAHPPKTRPPTSFLIPPHQQTRQTRRKGKCAWGKSTLTNKRKTFLLLFLSSSYPSSPRPVLFDDF
jgi:hypothetical protein